MTGATARHVRKRTLMLVRNTYAIVLILLVLSPVAWVSLSQGQIGELRQLRERMQEDLQAEREKIYTDDAQMMLIAEGPFWMGVDYSLGLEDEGPRHEVWLDAHYIDIHEVTTER